MQNTIAAGARKATSPLRYAVGMFGTSIPINMFKTYAAFFYIDKLGLITTQQFSLVLFLYTLSLIHILDVYKRQGLCSVQRSHRSVWRAA